MHEMKVVKVEGGELRRGNGNLQRRYNTEVASESV